MQQVFPPKSEVCSKWLSKMVLHLAETGLLEKAAKRCTELNRLRIYSEIDGLPNEVFVIKLDSQTWHTILPIEYASRILSGRCLDHIPLTAFGSLKILDSAGELITSLYFPRAVLSSLRSAKFMTAETPPYVFVSVECQMLLNNSIEPSYYEMLMDTDETLLYRAMAPFRSCALVDQCILFKTPSMPIIYAEALNASEFRIRTETPATKIVTGTLVKVALSLAPFPYFTFSFAECQIGNEVFDDVDIPSFLLFGFSSPIKEEMLYRINREAFSSFEKKRQIFEAEFPKENTLLSRLPDFETLKPANEPLPSLKV